MGAWIMAFFNDLGKKISQTSQDVIRKTKDASEIHKLDNLISDENKKITWIFREIGEKYYQLYATQHEECFDDYILRIEECKRKIEQLKEQINKIKAIKICPQCGKEISESARFCDSCGFKTEDAAETEKEENKNVCPQCRSAVEDTAVFCENCGAKLVSEPGQEEKISEEMVLKCKNCGYDIGDAAFCENCGTKVE